MNDLKPKLVRKVRLQFDLTKRPQRADAVRDNLSAVALGSDEHLWVATDEGAAVERLVGQGPGQYGDHEIFDLREYLKLPVDKGTKDEIDIEGLALEGGHLWVVGSHSMTRDKPSGRDKDPLEAIRQLSQVDANPNRRILARLSLDLFNEPDRSSPARTKRGGRHCGASQLRAGRKSAALLDMLADDEHLAPFMSLPAKENGFDIEGLAVYGDRVLLGLRGPVLRGWAVILELDIHAKRRKLKARRLATGGRRYRKHFLDLEGSGIRDMCFAGDDILILAGPTMALDGAVRVHRWTLPAGTDDTITSTEGCPAVMEVPSGRGCDRAEGMALVAGAAPPEVLVVYDGPHDSRIADDGGVYADVFTVPS